MLLHFIFFFIVLFVKSFPPPMLLLPESRRLTVSFGLPWHTGCSIAVGESGVAVYKSAG